MKQQHYKNLRYCEKIKETVCFIEADGLQKKIRKMKAGKQEGSIDAESKMREIDCFWKEGWEYDHTHHTFIQPRITTPHFFIERPSQARSSLKLYYQLLSRFVNKLKCEHEDETNYRINVQWYPQCFQQKIEGINDEIKTATRAFNHLLCIFRKASADMISNLKQSEQQAQEQMVELIDPNSVKQNLNFIQVICQVLLSKKLVSEEEQMIQQSLKQAKKQLIQFMAFMIGQLMESKAPRMFCEVIAIQPNMGQLTYLLHPLCWALYGLFSHEQIVRAAKKRRGKRYVDQEDQPLPLVHDDLIYKPMIKDDDLFYQEDEPIEFMQISDNSRQEEERHSKVVVLNLDGFESEYNLQFMRNFHDHVLYISFPKFDDFNEECSAYNNRFYKKVMFNCTKSQKDLFPELAKAFLEEELLEDPEHYHQVIRQLYESEEDTDPVKDFNKNMFIFPIRMDKLKSNQELTERERNIQKYQSYLIRFLLRDHLNSHMKKFKPKTIFISYSGRIKLLNEHYLQMIQQLEKICPKIIFFPNLTSAVSRFEAKEKNSRNSLEQTATKVLDVQHQTPWDHLVRNEDDSGNGSQIQIMEKLSIFLKVGSGHYNLQRICEEEQIDVRVQNSRIFSYVIHLFGALKNEYDHCKKRIQRDSLDAVKMVLNKGLTEHAKQLDRCIPPYYLRIFSEIQQLIKGKQCQSQDNQLLLEQLRQKVRQKVGWRGQEAQKTVFQKLNEMWRQLREIQCISLAGSKYHEVSYLQIHTEPGKDQFVGVKGEKMDNLDNVYRLSFCDRERNTEIVKIYKEATLLYQPLQHFRTHKQYFNLILTNLLDLEEQNYQNYFAKPKLGKSKHQRCPIVPILFLDRQGRPIVLREGQVLVEWSYAQTENYMMLYWPKLFDHVAYTLHSLLHRQYLPSTLPRLFIATKNHDLSNRIDPFIFHELNVPQGVEYIPRWGSAACFIDDQIFIFGGFHDRQASYLDLQNQISTIDLTGLAPQSYEPRKVINLRKQLYCGEVFQGHLREGRRPSSFVRPRMQFQFYDYDSLNLEDDMEEEGVRRVIMVGGVGEDFKTPHSLFVNYFYILRFDIGTRRLLSVQKKIIENKAIPVNVRGMIRNRGLFRRANVLDQREGTDPESSRCRQAIMNPNHHVAHRVVFALRGGQLEAKVKNLYALEMYFTCKRDFRGFGELVGEIRSVEEQDTMSIRRLEGNNHHLLVQVNESLFLYSIFLELRGAWMEQVPLMNESIISLDTKKFTVFALVCHSQYTHNKTHLVTETLIEPQPILMRQEKHYALVLKPLLVFPNTLYLHVLIVCNLNEVVVLQGLAIQGNVAAEYLVKVKPKVEKQVKKEQVAAKNEKQIKKEQLVVTKTEKQLKKQVTSSINEKQVKKEQSYPPTIALDQGQILTTFFFKKNNIITGFSFVRHPNHYELQLIKHTINLQKFSQGWREVSGLQKLCFATNGTRIRVSSIDLRLQNFGDSNILIKLSGYCGNEQQLRSYCVKLNSIGQEYAIDVSEMRSEDLQRIKNQQGLPFVIKTVDKYRDYGYTAEE